MSVAPDVSPPPMKRPQFSRDYEFFVEGLAQGRLMVQRCAACGVARHPPGPMCPHCNALDWSAEPLPPTGRVYSYVVHHSPPIPPHRTPHPVVLGEMAEGLRVLAAYRGDPAGLRIGAPIRLGFAEVGEGFTLHHFLPDEEGTR